MKKINETTKDLAVRSAEILNEIIKDANSDIGAFTATRSEWTKIFSEYKLPYRHITVKRLIDDKLLIKADEKRNANNRMYDLYSFDIKSIGYTYLMSIHDKQREKGIKNHNKNKMKKEKPRTFSIANHGVSITSLDENKLKDFTDSDLVTELRKRGYEVTAEKITVIKL